MFWNIYNKITEACRVRLKIDDDLTNRSMTIFSHNEISDVLPFSFGVVQIITMEKNNYISVLFKGSMQIRELRYI